MTDAREIARSIMDEIVSSDGRRTYQNRVVRRIREEYGEEWSYKNKNGNWAINRSILAELKLLKTEHVIWDRSDQSWRIVTDEQLAVIREREARAAERRAVRDAARAEREASQRRGDNL